MTALLNMPRAAWKQQPQNVVYPSGKYNYPGSMFFNAGCLSGYGFPYTAVGAVSRGSYSSGYGVSSDTTTSYIRTGRPLQAIAGKHTVVVVCHALNSAKSYVSGTVDLGNSVIEDILLNSQNEVGSAGKIEIFLRTETNTRTLANTDVLFNAGDFLSFAFQVNNNGLFDLALHGKIKPLNYTSSIPFTSINQITDYPIALLNRNLRNSLTVGTGVVLYAWARIPAMLDIQSLSENPWQIFAPRPSRFYLIPSGGASSVYQDGLIRWHILAAIQQDATLRWDVRITAQNDVLTRWNVLEGVLADTALRWDSLAEIQQDSVLRWDIASALSSVQQDAALRWHLLTASQQDVITRWNLLASIQSDVVSRWNLLTAAQQDTIIRWNTLTTAEQDALLRWNALQSLESNQTLRWDVLSEVLSAQNDVTLRWNTLSTIQQDALLRWNLAIAVEQSLATRWNLLNAVEISHAVRWDIAVAVANEVLLRWNSVESLSASNDLNLTWNLIAVAENDLELRWNLGDSSVTPDIRIFLVRGEDRTFHLAVSDRIFGVQ